MLMIARAAMLAACLALGFPAVAQTDDAENCRVESITTILATDERVVTFDNCRPGVIANAQVLAPVLERLNDIEITARAARLDGHDWLVTDVAWLERLVATGQALWRPTLDVALSPESPSRLSSATLSRQASAAFALPAIDHQAIRAREGEFVVVTGTITEVKKIDERWFVNFGEDFRDDFTVGLQGFGLEHFVQTHTRPSAFEGKTVMVMGVVEWFNGPFIELSNGFQIIVKQ